MRNFNNHSSYRDDKNLRILNDTWEITKALTVNGANINLQIKVELSDAPLPFELRRDSLNISCRYSAMFVLQSVFHRFPEFQEFAAAVEPTVMRPLRKIDYIHDGHRRGQTRAYPSEEESEMLWPLAEKWEQTFDRDDFDELHLAMTWVWEAHRHHFNSRGESDEDSDEETIEVSDEAMIDDSDEEMANESDEKMVEKPDENIDEEAHE